MKHQVYFGIAIRIVILFGVAMLWTFINPELRTFFGDTPAGGCSSGALGVDCNWNWGARHYWYWWMMFLLFCLSLVNAVVGIYNVITKYYPNL